MSQRTSFEDQLAAVSRLARRTGDAALQDAVLTLSLLSKANRTLYEDQPDTTEFSNILERLFTG